VAEGTSVGGFPSAWFTNAFQKTIKGGVDLIVTKIAGDGSHVIWATYLGGSGDEGFNTSIRVDAAKNVYVLDPTNSPDLPVTAGGRGFGGDYDLYIAKIDSSGRTLRYGTYLGGTLHEDAETHGLALNAQDEVYATGYTTSIDYPTTPGAYQTSPGRNPNVPGDMFLSHLSTTGVLLQSTYYGGSGGEQGEGIVTDAQGNVYVSGFVGSSAAQVPQTLTSGPLGGNDLLVVKFNPTLSQRLFSARAGHRRGPEYRPRPSGGHLHRRAHHGQWLAAGQLPAAAVQRRAQRRGLRPDRPVAISGSAGTGCTGRCARRRRSRPSSRSSCLRRRSGPSS
jgi:hypothetical protein